uniref:Putative group vii salivary lipocalin n=1 Tax=Rhipicephalus pulchellus TaxID=72859 RepID=L7M893_RHIPC
MKKDMTKVMGCNVSLLVVLLCWLPPVHMYGDCPRNLKVRCRENGLSPEDTCPGVSVSCEKGQEVCACPHMRYRSSKGFQCVNYQDCVEKKFDTLVLLKEQVDLYLVGTNNEVLDKKPYRCMTSKYVSSSSTQVNRDLVFQQRVKNPLEERSDKPQAYSVDGTKWRPRVIKLVFWVQDGNNRIIHMINERSYENEKVESEAFHVLHATEKCIIIAAGPADTGKFLCTMWVKKDDVEFPPFDCEFIFKQHCDNPGFVREIDPACESSSA